MMWQYLRSSLVALALALALALTLPVTAGAAGDEQTINPIPTPASGQWLDQLELFLNQEDADRYTLIHNDFVSSGGVISTGAGLTKTPTSLVAFINGFYTTESGNITFADNETTWVIASKDRTGDLGTFTRVSGTHYLTDSASATEPALPTDTVWISKVTTSGGSVTAVTDMRVTSPDRLTVLAAGEDCLTDITGPSDGAICYMPHKQVYGIYDATAGAWKGINFTSPLIFGASGDGEEGTDATTTSASDIITLASRDCTTDDVGKVLDVAAAAAGSPASYISFRVQACSGTNFDVDQNAGQSIAGTGTWELGTDNSTPIQAMLDAMELTGQAGRIPYDETGRYILTTAVEYNTAKDVALFGDPDTWIVRSPDCERGSGNGKCVIGGSSVFVRLDTDASEDNTVTVIGLGFDGNNDFESTDTDSRTDLLVMLSANYNIERNRFRNSTSFNFRTFNDTGEPFHNGRFVNNRWEGCWEGAFHFKGSAFGSTARPANYYIAGNQGRCPEPHPNDTMTLTGALGVGVEPDVGSTGFIETFYFLNNSITCGDNDSSFAVNANCLSLNLQGDIFIRKRAINNNQFTANVKGIRRLVRIGPMTADNAGDNMSSTSFVGNQINLPDAAQTLPIVFIESGFTGSTPPTNRQDYLTVKDNVIHTAGNQTQPGINVQGYWHSVMASGNSCDRQFGAGGANYTGCISYTGGNIVNLSPGPTNAWDPSNNLAFVPYTLEDGNDYGILPDYPLVLARTAPDNGDSINLGTFGLIGCLQIGIVRQNTSATYNACIDTASSNTWFRIPEDDFRYGGTHDWHLEINENSGTGRLSLRIWQRIGAAAGEPYIVMVRQTTASEAAVGHMIYTPSSTDNGAQAAVTTARIRSKERWRWFIDHADVAGVGQTATETILTAGPDTIFLSHFFCKTVEAWAHGTATTIEGELGDGSDADAFLTDDNTAGPPPTKINLKMNNAEFGIAEDDLGTLIARPNAVQGGYWMATGGTVVLTVTLDAGAIDDLTAGSTICTMDIDTSLF